MRNITLFVFIVSSCGNYDLPNEKPLFLDFTIGMTKKAVDSVCLAYQRDKKFTKEIYKCNEAIMDNINFIISDKTNYWYTLPEPVNVKFNVYFNYDSSSHLTWVQLKSSYVAECSVYDENLEKSGVIFENPIGFETFNQIAKSLQNKYGNPIDTLREVPATAGFYHNMNEYKDKNRTIALTLIKNEDGSKYAEVSIRYINNVPSDTKKTRQKDNGKKSVEDML